MGAPDLESPVGRDSSRSGGAVSGVVTDLRWRLVLSLGALQVGPATLALFDVLPQWLELLVGVLLGLVWVAVLWLRRVDRPFLSGVFVGLSAGVVTAVVQGSFVDVYLRTHPELVQANPDGSTLAWVASIVGVSLVGGVIAGLLTGGLAWLLVRFR